MDYEKKYKEALERAKSEWVNNLDNAYKNYRERLEIIFPELKESEDEKVRKALINLFKIENFNGYITLNGIDVDDVIAWLEKQGEKDKLIEDKDKLIKELGEYKVKYTQEVISQQLKNQVGEKPTDKAKPKFKVGDWITNGNAINHISNIRDDSFYCFDYGPSSDMIQYIDNTYHLWTIQDAEDGDVLQLGKVTAIFQKYIGNGNCRCYCSVYNGEFEIPSQDGDDNSYGCVDAIPATKEQCDLLFSKMKDAGHEFDFEKKELKKIHVIDEGKAEMDYCFTKMMNGEKVSSAWTEEDEKNWCGIMDEIEANKSNAPDYDIETYDRFLSWIENIKQRINNESIKRTKN